MNDIEKILPLLARKKSLFDEYERHTNQLSQADEDTSGNYITKRSALAIEIDNINAEINALTQINADDRLKKALLCEGDYSEYKPPLLEVYNISREIYAAISRIKDKNEEIVANMGLKLEEARKKLSETKNTPKIKKYLGALSSSGQENVFMSGDKKV